jgi:hypothetical protein
MRKRIIVVLCTLLCALSGAVAAYAQKDIINTYSAKQNAEVMTLSKGEFNLMKPLLGLDKQTKQILRALNIQSVDFLVMNKCSREDKDSFIKSVNLLHESGAFISIAKSEPEAKLEKGDFLFKPEDDRITEMLIYFDGSDEGNEDFLVMRFFCNALAKDIAEIVQ